jgi:hypothetical protein
MTSPLQPTSTDQKQALASSKTMIAGAALGLMEVKKIFLDERQFRVGSVPTEKLAGLVGLQLARYIRFIWINTPAAVRKIAHKHPVLAKALADYDSRFMPEELVGFGVFRQQLIATVGGYEGVAILDELSFGRHLVYGCIGGQQGQILGFYEGRGERFLIIVTKVVSA